MSMNMIGPGVSSRINQMNLSLVSDDTHVYTLWRNNDSHNLAT